MPWETNGKDGGEINGSKRMEKQDKRKQFVKTILLKSRRGKEYKKATQLF
jgi:hypothetical protein